MEVVPLSVVVSNWKEIKREVVKQWRTTRHDWYESLALRCTNPHLKKFLENRAHKLLIKALIS
jgi:DNA-binding GntR family transcriptional regulator